MSDCIVPVAAVSSIKEHPNASLLCIVEVLGYQMISGLVEDPNGTIPRDFLEGERDERGRRVPCPDEITEDVKTETVMFRFPYKENEHCVYFPADTVLTDEWAEKFEVRHLLKSNNRIGRTRLRGEPSFGLIVHLPEGVDWEIGRNVAEYYDATKWMPPVRADPGDFAPYNEAIDPHFVKYTDIQNGRVLFEKFQPQEPSVVMEKIHGTNSRVALIEAWQVAGSRTTRKAEPEYRKKWNEHTYWLPWIVPGVMELMTELRRKHKHVILFGEVYGLQSLKYGVDRRKGYDYRAFDICVDGEYMNYTDFQEICDKHSVPTVPVLFIGEFDLAKILELADGRSLIPGADNIREGVVVKPLEERRDPTLGRVILKFIGTEYDLSKHKKKDTTDV